MHAPDTPCSKADIVPAKPGPDLGLSVLAWIEQGLTPEDIISRGLARIPLVDLVRMVRTLTDSRRIAKARLNSAAAEMAEKVIASDDPKDSLAALRGIGVLRTEAQLDIDATITTAVRVVFEFQSHEGKPLVLDAEAVGKLAKI